MDVGPGQFQALCARATDLENTVAELGREAMAVADLGRVSAISGGRRP